MDTSNKSEKKKETYKIPCIICGGETDHEIIIISRKFGIKLKCLKCKKEVHKNLKYLEGKKNVE